MTSQTNAELAEELERVAKTYGIEHAIHLIDQDQYREIIAALRAEPAGEPVATVRVGSMDHGPFIFKETPYGADHLPDGKSSLYTHSPSPSALAEWQPIESAPKDGTRIIATWIGGDEWDTELVSWAGDEWIDSAACSYRLDESPTLWQPLPPVAAEAGK